MSRRRHYPGQLEHALKGWREAANEEIADELGWYLRRYHGRWGYQPDEQPLYAPCRLCNDTLRVDRLDLILEHLRAQHGPRHSERDLVVP